MDHHKVCAHWRRVVVRRLDKTSVRSAAVMGLLLIAFANRPVMAQQPIAAALNQAALSTSQIDADLSGSPGEYEELLAARRSDLDSLDGHMPRIYYKSGVFGVAGSGDFENIFNGGWTAQVGYRDWLNPNNPGSGNFVEFGGGFTVNSRGSRKRGTVGGVFHAAGDDHDHPLDELFQVQLQDAYRGFVQAAVGHAFEPMRIRNSERHLLQLSLRGGGRIGHLSASFDREPTSGLQAVIDDHLAHGHTADGLEFRSTVKTQDTDTYGGLFGSIGAGLLYYDVYWGDWCLGDLAVEAEVEFAHDWINLAGFDDSGLGMVAGMFTVTWLR